MPNCFQLTKIGENSASKLVDVDAEMCKHFGVAVHPTDWYRQWYDIVGWEIAVNGRSFDKIIDMARMGRIAAYFENDAARDERLRHLEEITEWLKANYSSDAWVQIGK